MKEDIALLLEKTLAKKGVRMGKGEIEGMIEIPPSQEMGDYAFPCFFLAKTLKKNPNAIAEEMAEEIPKGGFNKIHAYNGYVNFFMDRKRFSEGVIRKILGEEGDFGKEDVGKGGKVLIEHTSINPNASPHIGRARNAIIGDSLVRIHRFLNFRPEVHYYVNDVSKQIAMLAFAGAEKLKFGKMLSKYSEIARKVEASQKLEEKVLEVLNGFEKGDKKIAGKMGKITSIAVRGQKKILSELGIHYDFFDYESSYLGRTEGILSQLRKTGKLFVDENGRQVLGLKNTIVEGKMKSPVLVLTRGDGTGLYPLRDIAYTMSKMDRSRNNIIVLGEDQKLYFQQLKEALRLLNYGSPEVVHYSFILLSSGGKSKKMSTRKGDVVLLEDFLEEAERKAGKKSKSKKAAKGISIAAVKYAILKNHPNKSISFNLDDALNFEGDTGPYLLYSYARACSILKKAGKKPGIKASAEKVGEKEFELLKKLSQFPDIVLASYKTLNSSLIANYSYQISQLFNEFYHSSHVIGSEDENFRLIIVECFRNTLKNSLSLLGIDAMDRM
jgi:arginyl-tRNA synthetase